MLYPIKTVGDLIEDLKKYPTDMPIVRDDSDMECHNSYNYGYHLYETTYAVVKSQCWDAFDGTPYTKEHLQRSESGDIKALTIQ